MNIAIIGQGGHSKVIQDIISINKNIKIVGYFDDKFYDFKTENGIYYGPVSYASLLLNHFDEIRFMIAIGNNGVRKAVVEKLGIPSEYYATLVHESARISSSAVIENGSVVMANAVINAGVRIGKHSIINTCAVVEHDNELGDFVHISPNATLTGTVEINDGVHVGAGAVIIPNVKIGEWSIVGAGATVIHDLPANCTAVGVPAKIKMKVGDIN
jgi:acetyltransferase EpsM